MPKSTFKEMWDTIKVGKSWEGYVKNMRKDRGYYWVYAIISGVYKDGKLVEYKSLRSPVEKSKRIEMQYIYDKMRYEEGERVRAVTYIDREIYDKLISKSKEIDKSIEELLKFVIQ